MVFQKLHACDFGDKWWVGNVILDDRPMLIRIRQNLQQMVGHPELPNRLRVVWDYRIDNGSGLPSQEVGKKMEQCESAMVAPFEHDIAAIMTHVLICKGLRQWVFYSSDVQLCVERMNDILPHDPPFAN